MNLALDPANTLPIIGVATPDGALIAAIGQRHPHDRMAAQILHSRHADALRAAAVAQLGEHLADAADAIVDAVFLGLLFGVATEFAPGRPDALPWLESIARRTASEHLRAGALEPRCHE
jgi:DNA-directed RNA polymerase specialized sigma24 family protein